MKEHTHMLKRASDEAYCKETIRSVGIMNMRHKWIEVDCTKCLQFQTSSSRTNYETKIRIAEELKEKNLNKKDLPLVKKGNSEYDINKLRTYWKTRDE